MSETAITFTIAFTDPDLDAEEQDAQAQWLMDDLRQMDEVDEVNRVSDPNPPDGNKAAGGFLAGLLMAEVSVDNAKKVLGFLGDRLGGKPIELEVEGNGKKLKVSAYSREELQAAIQSAQEFIG